MIKVEDALAVAIPRPEPEKIVLDDEEQVLYDYVDSIVDTGICRNFNGEVFDIKIPAKFASSRVIAYLKQEYEKSENGWSIGVFPRYDMGALLEVQIVFAPTPRMKPEGRKKPLPILTAPTLVQSTGQASRFLVRMPTRGRPGQALSVLNEYRAKAGMPITIEVVVDEDDASMLASDVLQRLRALDCVVTVGKHKSKVEAVNGGSITDWDVLLLASDDMLPVKDGYAVTVLDAMKKHFPFFDGAIFFDDGYAHGRCCTLPIVGRRFYDQFGFVYEKEYASLCCDVEQTEIWQQMGRLTYIDELLIEHKHPAAGKALHDELYDRTQASSSRKSFT